MALIALAFRCFLLRDRHFGSVISNTGLSRLELPCVKSLGSEQRNVVVAPGSDGSGQSEQKPKDSTSPFSGLWRKEKAVSYSTLLKDIDAGKIKQLDLVPAKREVRVQYKDGRRFTVPVFTNDNQILRAAESSGTALTVVDVRREQASRELAGTLFMVLLLVIGLSLLLRRSAQMANKMGESGHP